MEAEYDVTQAKFCASLLWFVCRISENEECDVPPEITSPLENSTTNELLVHPAVVEYLTSGVMYFKVASGIYDRPFNSFWDLLHYLSKNGIYVDNEAITDKDLHEKYPFKMTSHVCLMDAVLQSYINCTATIQDFLVSIKKFSSFNASREMPFDIEDAVVLWINKLNMANTSKHLRKNQSPAALPPEGGNARLQVRRDQLVEAKMFPSVQRLHNAFNDGKSLLSIVLFFFPGAFNIDGIKLSSVLSSDEKFANIEMFRSLCAQHICTSVFALRIEDFYFSCDELKNNFLALLCEILCSVKNNEHGIQQHLDKSQEVTITSASSRPSSAHHHQPLLSKRSKKQFAKFETAVSQDKPSQNNDIRFDDLDLKQSHTVAPTQSEGMHHHPPTASFAWGESKKQSKISLDFRPETTSSLRQNVIAGVATTDDDHQSSLFNEADHQSLPYKQQPSKTSSSHPDHDSRVVWQHDDKVSRSHHNDAMQPQPPAVQRAGVNHAHGGNYNSMAPMYRLVCEPDLSSIEVSHDVDEKPEVEIADTSVKKNTDPEDEEEDALSTITETSEPGTPTALTNSIPTRSLHDEVIKHRPINSQETFAALSAQQKSMEETGASYTIQEATVENAIANGLPIINSDRSDKANVMSSSDVNNELHYVDVNSSQEVCGMEMEKTDDVRQSSRDEKPSVNIPTVLAENRVSKSFAEPSRSPAQSLDATGRTQGHYEGATGEILQTQNTIPSALSSSLQDLDTRISYQARSHTGDNTRESLSTKESPKTLRSSFPRTVIPDDPILDSHAVKRASVEEEESRHQARGDHVQMLNNDPTTQRPTNMHQQQQTLSLTAQTLIQDDDNDVDDKHNPTRQKQDYFNRVSYEHWPFTKKKNDKNTRLVRVDNVKEYYLEQLDILRNSRNATQQSYPVITSWLNDSGKDGGDKLRLTLEEREERLKKIQERRLQAMGSGVTTTWSNISRQNQQQKYVEQKDNDVADVLDGALDTGISIIDTLAKLSDLADEGHIDRKKCFKQLDIEQEEKINFDENNNQDNEYLSSSIITTNEEQQDESNHSGKPDQCLISANCITKATEIHSGINAIDPNGSDHAATIETSGGPANTDYSETTKTSTELVTRWHHNSDAGSSRKVLNRRTTFVLEQSPIKTFDDATAEGIPIIEALGDLCNVADNFLKDYTQEPDGEISPNKPKTPSTPEEFDFLINSKVSEILLSFQKLDSTVDLLKKKALRDNFSNLKDKDKDLRELFPSEYREMLTNIENTPASNGEQSHEITTADFTYSPSSSVSGSKEKNTGLHIKIPRKPKTVKERPGTYTLTQVLKNISPTKIEIDINSDFEIDFNSRQQPENASVGCFYKPHLPEMKVLNKNLLSSSKRLPDLHLFPIDVDYEPLEKNSKNNVESGYNLSRERPGTYVLSSGSSGGSSPTKSPTKSILNNFMQNNRLGANENNFDRNSRSGTFTKESSTSLTFSKDNNFDRNARPGTYVKESGSSLKPDENHFDRNNRSGTYTKDLGSTQTPEEDNFDRNKRFGTYTKEFETVLSPSTNNFDRNARPGTYVKESGSSLKPDENHFDRNNRSGTYTKDSESIPTPKGSNLSGKKRPGTYVMEFETNQKPNENNKLGTFAHESGTSLPDNENYFDRETRPGTYVKESGTVSLTENNFDRRNRPGTYVLSPSKSDKQGRISPGKISKSEQNSPLKSKLFAFENDNLSKSVGSSPANTSKMSQEKLIKSEQNSPLKSKLFAFETESLSKSLGSSSAKTLFDTRAQSSSEADEPASDRKPKSSLLFRKSQSLSNIKQFADQSSTTTTTTTNSFQIQLQNSRLAVSQPSLCVSSKDSRKKSMGNSTFSKLGLLKKAMSASLTKLTQLHAVQRQISLSTNTLTGSDSNLSDEDVDKTLTSPRSEDSSFESNTSNSPFLRSSFSEPISLVSHTQNSDTYSSMLKSPSDEETDGIISAAPDQQEAVSATFSHQETLRSVIKNIEYDFQDEELNSDCGEMNTAQDSETPVKNSGVVLREKKGRSNTPQQNTSTYVLAKEPQLKQTFTLDDESLNSNIPNKDQENIADVERTGNRVSRKHTFSYTHQKESESLGDHTKSDEDIDSDKHSEETPSSSTSLSPLRRQSTVDKNNKPKTMLRKTSSPDQTAGIVDSPPENIGNRHLSSPRKTNHTVPVHSNFLRRKSRGCDTARKEKALQDDLPLSSRLAALRMQLEEKRRQFEEEKKTKLKEWNEERAEALQNAFFIAIDEKENKDPSTRPAAGQDNNPYLSQTNGNKSLSPREYIRKKQLEKQKETESSPSQRAQWFVDMDEDEEEEEVQQRRRITTANSWQADTADDQIRGSLKKTSHSLDPTQVGTDDFVISSSLQDHSATQPCSQTPMENNTIPPDTVTEPVVDWRTPLSHAVDNYDKPQVGCGGALTRNTERLNQEGDYTHGEVQTSFATDTYQQTQVSHTEPQTNMTDQRLSGGDILPNDEKRAVDFPPPTSTRTSQQPEEVSHIAYQQDEDVKQLMNENQNTIDVFLNEQQQEQKQQQQQQRLPVPFPEEKLEPTAPQKINPTIDALSNNLAALHTGESSPSHVTVATDNVLSEQSPTLKKAEPSSLEMTPTKLAFTFGDEITESPGMTPEQLRKRERFLKIRQKQMEEKKAKREADLEKKRRKDEELLLEKMRLEEEQKLKKEQHRLQRAQSLEEERHDAQRQQFVAKTTSPPPPTQFERRKPDNDTPRRIASASPRLTSAGTSSSAVPDVGEEKRFAEYTGPAAYQKPSGKSNRKIVHNAISHCCLVGSVNRDAKEKCLEAIEKSQCHHFLVLFRDPMKFRGVYEYYPETELVTKIYGTGPKSVTPKMTEKFFRYNSGGKSFNALQMKQISIQCDGMSIKKELWEQKKQSAPSSKTNTSIRKKIR